MIGKKFVTIDEGHITNERGYTNFKSLITEDFIWARLMYQALAKYLNYSVFILLTNKPTGIELLAANERRFPIFKPSSRMVGDKAYFDKLFQWINSRGEKTMNWYIYPYFFVSQIQDPAFLKKVQAFDFANYKTRANQILTGESLENWKLFIVCIWADPTGHGNWYQPKKEISKKIIYTYFQEFCAKQTRNAKRAFLGYDNFFKEITGIVNADTTHPLGKNKNTRDNSIITLDRVEIQKAFVTRIKCDPTAISRNDFLPSEDIVDGDFYNNNDQ